MKLASFASNTYSQFGEDGILSTIFEHIGTGSKVCIEFGAWDGFHLSNTANLWTNGWKGILIEGDAGKAALLQQNVAPYNCNAICRYVGTTAGDTLEDILEGNGLPLEADLLSIDIDGDDYHIFDSLKKLCPRVVVCEYNPTIPYWLDLYAEIGSYFGASVEAFRRLSDIKGYRLVAVTETNCIFVRNDEFAKLSHFTTNIDEIAVKHRLTHIITSYSGEYFICGSIPYGLTSRGSTEINGNDEVISSIKNNDRVLILGKNKLNLLIKELMNYFKHLLR